MEQTKGRAQEIAETTLAQLGGKNRLVCMIGAKNFSYSASGELAFAFAMCRKANAARIALNANDLYDIQFLKYDRNFQSKVVETFSDVYASELRSTMETFTGLYLSL